MPYSSSEDAEPIMSKSIIVLLNSFVFVKYVYNAIHALPVTAHPMTHFTTVIKIIFKTVPLA